MEEKINLAKGVLQNKTSFQLIIKAKDNEYPWKKIAQNQSESNAQKKFSAIVSDFETGILKGLSQDRRKYR